MVLWQYNLCWDRHRETSQREMRKGIYMKKIAGLLAVMMLLAVVPSATFAQEEEVNLLGENEIVLAEASDETYTMDEIVDGNLVVYQDHKFDSSFDTTKLDDMMVNHTGGVKPENFVIGENGLEVKAVDTGAWFVWGAAEGWSPRPDMPMQFRMKLGENTIAGLEIGRPEVLATIYPNKITLKTGTKNVDATTVTCTNFLPGTDWVTYLLTTEDTNGNGVSGEVGDLYSLYAKKDGDAEYTLVKTLTFFSSGFYGFNLTVSAPKGSSSSVTPTAYLDYLTVYKIREDKPILTDKNAILIDNQDILADETLDSAENWELNGKFANQDGMLKLDMAGSAETSSIVCTVPTEGYDFTGDWYINFKLAMNEPTGGSFGILSAGKKRIVFTINQSTFSTGSTGAVAMPTLSWNTMYEWLFAIKDFNTFSVYRRLADSNAEWTCILQDATMEARTPDYLFQLGNGKWSDTATMSLDSLKIYRGSYAKLGHPVVDNGSVTTTGSFLWGTPDAEEDRRLSVITAVYDKKYGYTTAVEKKDYLIYGGETVDLTNSYSFAGLDAEKNDVSVMAWDAVETGLPLLVAAETAPRNTTEEKPAEGQAVGLKCTTTYNEVRIHGWLGAIPQHVTASISKGDSLVAVSQMVSNEYGMIDSVLAVNPETCASGEYTLRLQYGDNEVHTDVITLYSGSDVKYNEITDTASLQSFLKTYGDDQTKQWAEVDSFAAAVYEKLEEAKDESSGFANLYEFRAALEPIVADEGFKVDMLVEINNAVAGKRWEELETLLTKTYQAEIGINSDALTGIKNHKELFLRMTKNYQTVNEVLLDFNAAVTAQQLFENSTLPGSGGGMGGSGGFGGGAGGAKAPSAGGGFGGGGNVTIEKENPSILPEIPAEPVEEFQDLSSVGWAEESIRELQLRGVLKGDGDGMFYPNRAITREEFLKIVMEAAEIPASNEVLSFADVDRNAWYYPYVAGAYQLDIITGMDSSQFGIGKEITRADMAVILERVLKYCQVDVDMIKTAIIFDDYKEIPDYASSSISILYTGGLMQGVGDNRFAPQASTTRAEAATAVYRIYKYMDERR